MGARKNKSRLEIVKERCNDIEQNFDLDPFPKKPKKYTDWANNLKLVTFFMGCTGLATF